MLDITVGWGKAGWYQVNTKLIKSCSLKALGFESRLREGCLITSPSRGISLSMAKGRNSAVFCLEICERIVFSMQFNDRLKQVEI